MLRLVGQSAYSALRLKQKLSAVQQACSGVAALHAHHVYFVDVDVLSREKTHRLETLLSARVFSDPLLDHQYLIAPRIGTTSPWSSKASDIVHACGLSDVRRVEHGLLFSVEGGGALPECAAVLHDRMTESVLPSFEDARFLFEQHPFAPSQRVAVKAGGKSALSDANKQNGFALSDDEIEFLFAHYQTLERDPSDAELMMFAQVNSEHCRHKIFNADWVVDGHAKDRSLFSMIRHTHAHYSGGVLSAYHDNAAVLEGPSVDRFYSHPVTRAYTFTHEPAHLVIKVETHNHPTAIAPFPGAATGAGGEIRDEGATGRGAKPKAGLCGFAVSHLCIPAFHQPWEFDCGRPQHMASALDIMVQGPIGAASFNNEFGRPNLMGFFRTFQMNVNETIRGYHKPIMIAGGVGNITKGHVNKQKISAGAQLIVLGGPAMKIGLGGGAASSMTAGTAESELDFASVQRSNPEMERRCQEVINACWAMGDDNPIIALHDVGAGGLSNALPELVSDSGRGGRFNLRAIPTAEPGMSPLALWCNESQERYVLAISNEQYNLFERFANRERCPFAVVGEATEEEMLHVDDVHFSDVPVDLPMSTLFAKPPKMQRDVKTVRPTLKPIDISCIKLSDAAERVLQFPAVADKRFLITIGDRTVTGLVARDQLVGPWQVAVSDVAVTTSSINSFSGEAMAMGERPPVALINPAAAARLSVGEAITNLAAAHIAALENIKLSANWMAASGEPGEDAALFEAVQEVGMSFCPALNICVPVGKDSLSMKSVWQKGGEQHAVTSPLSLVISGFAPVVDVRNTWTPQLRTDVGETALLFIDLGDHDNGLGASVLAQVYQKLGECSADSAAPAVLKNFFSCMQVLHEKNQVLAYHDRSDGGLFATLSEMAFAGHCGLDVRLDGLGESAHHALFNESLGVVLQVRDADLTSVLKLVEAHHLKNRSVNIATLRDDDVLNFYWNDAVVLSGDRVRWHRLWSSTSYRIQALRDNPECAQQEYDALLDKEDPGLSARICFEDSSAPSINTSVRPRVAILREQGVNGHVEMAAAFDRAGFQAMDVHMHDILSGDVTLDDVVGLVACGGFSYGDVLGAGRGWANSILYHARARDQFSKFFDRPNTFSLGVCNGCQMLSQLRALIPGAEHWPDFVRNRSEQFEARLSLVEILPSPSLFFSGMQGSFLPLPVAHGEGLVDFGDINVEQALPVLRYLDHAGQPTERYPFNPNGSAQGLTGFTSVDGRATIMMPHPERAFRSLQLSWHPDDWPEESPWLRMFINARKYV